MGKAEDVGNDKQVLRLCSKISSPARPMLRIMTLTFSGVECTKKLCFTDSDSEICECARASLDLHKMMDIHTRFRRLIVSVMQRNLIDY